MLLVKSNNEILDDFIDLMVTVRPELNKIECKQNIKHLVRYYQGKQIDNPLIDLETRWFNSLDDQQPDYTIYADETYFMEVWACWEIYSRQYLKAIHKNSNEFVDIKTVLDLGCGVGLSTASLSEIFPTAKVIGTQLNQSEQWLICEQLTYKYNFDLREHSLDLGQQDLIFASEYFEHFERPIEHLLDILHYNTPKMLLIANSFGTVGIGHFKVYKHLDELIDWKIMSKRFNKVMRDNNYRLSSTLHFWNNRPAVWVKIPNKPTLDSFL